MVAGAVAYAAIPTANGTISACYAKQGGAVRVIDEDGADASSVRTYLGFGNFHMVRDDPSFKIIHAECDLGDQVINASYNYDIGGVPTGLSVASTADDTAPVAPEAWEVLVKVDPPATVGTLSLAVHCRDNAAPFTTRRTMKHQRLESLV